MFLKIYKSSLAFMHKTFNLKTHTRAHTHTAAATTKLLYACLSERSSWDPEREELTNGHHLRTPLNHTVVM